MILLWAADGVGGDTPPLDSMSRAAPVSFTLLGPPQVLTASASVDERDARDGAAERTRAM